MKDPFFQAMIQKQFRDLQKSDRFYFENGPNNVTNTPAMFTMAQLNEIRKATVGRLICDNVAVSYMPWRIWRVLNDTTVNNVKVPCSFYQANPVNWTVFAV
jgi:hypothetical protein